MAKKTVKKFWDALPKEIRVLPYVALAGAGTAVYKQLEITEVQNLLVMGIINIVLVLLKERIPEIKKRLFK